MKYEFNYLVEIQYLGFRYSGWAKQPKQKTIHGFIDKTLSFVFEHDNFKTLGCSRTDSKVSANQNFFQLFTNEAIEKESWLLSFNSNLPPDIKAISVCDVSSNFNIIKAVSHKTYEYQFSLNNKNHPFIAPYVTNHSNSLNISLMEKGAKLFIGTHNFMNYCTELNENKQTIKTISDCAIIAKKFELGSEAIDCHVLTITGNGFLRHQIRLMMAQLFLLGESKVTIQDLKQSLEVKHPKPFRNIAPASGLTLRNVYFSR